MMLGQLDINVQKELSWIPTLYHIKMNSKWIMDVNERAKIVKFLRGKHMSKFLCS
jgi:hypothetical protein